MPSGINRVPLGLLDLLGIKSTGQNPYILLDEVRPTIELLQFYLALDWEYVSGSTAAITAGGSWAPTNGAFTPNPGELFIVDNLTVSRGTAIPAATTYRLRCAISNAQTGTVYSASPHADTVTAGESFAMGWGQSVIIRPGESGSIWAEAVTLGTASVFNVAGRVARLVV